MTRPILTNRQIKKLDEIEYIICEFPPLKKGGECVRVSARDLFVSYAPTLAGTPIKNISTRLRDFWDFVRWCASKMPPCLMVLIRINDENIDAYSNYLKTELNNNKNTTLVKMSHIRAVFRWAEVNWDPQNERREKGMIGRAWKYKPRGKPFQKKEKGKDYNKKEKECDDYSKSKCKNFLFDLMGVAQDATHQEIKAAYRRRMVQIHPDHGGTEDQAKALNLAYDFLSKNRVEYDVYISTNDICPFPAVADEETKQIYKLFGGYAKLEELKNPC